jgi:hypothetical protein
MYQYGKWKEQRQDEFHARRMIRDNRFRKVRPSENCKVPRYSSRAKTLLITETRLPYNSIMYIKNVLQYNLHNCKISKHSHRLTHCHHLITLSLPHSLTLTDKHLKSLVHSLSSPFTHTILPYTLNDTLIHTVLTQHSHSHTLTPTLSLTDSPPPLTHTFLLTQRHHTFNQPHSLTNSHSHTLCITGNQSFSFYLSSPVAKQSC